MCIAPATESNTPERLTHENIQIHVYVSLQEVQFILACYIILRYLIIKHSEDSRVKTTFEIKECQNGGTHLKETGNL